MSKFSDFFSKINGSKTVIGLALLQLAPFFPAYSGAITLIGQLLTGVGLAHKAVKVVQ